jgi:hypothetical protein
MVRSCVVFYVLCYYDFCDLWVRFIYPASLRFHVLEPIISLAHTKQLSLFPLHLHTNTNTTNMLLIGNYGETGWLGINEVLKSVPQNIIQSSVAKMNEHYLLNAGYDERLYTMCHELGHGYGLPHTDENFNNKDLGNCLDYTNNPSNNLRPGQQNCNRLLEMYGAVNVGRKKTRTLRYRSDAEMYEDFESDFDEEKDESSESESTTTTKTSTTTYYDDDSRYYFEDARSQYPDMTAEYEKAMEELYYDISQGNIISKQQQQQQEEQEQEQQDEDDNEEEIPTSITDVKRGKWRCLREHPRGGDFSRRLNDGFILEVHVLFPPSSSSTR